MSLVIALLIIFMWIFILLGFVLEFAGNTEYTAVAASGASLIGSILSIIALILSHSNIGWIVVWLFLGLLHHLLLKEREQKYFLSFKEASRIVILKALGKI
jgi:hypothetical protein